MKLKTLLIALCALAFLAVGHLAAGPHGSGPHGSGPHGSGHGGFFGLDSHAHAAIGQLIQDLNLSAEQQEHLAALHHRLAAHQANRATAHRAHLHLLMRRLEAGPLDPVAARAEIDVYLEQTRLELYAAVDAMGTLVNSFDEVQREKLTAHVAEARAHQEAHAAEHAAEHGKHGSKDSHPSHHH